MNTTNYTMTYPEGHTDLYAEFDRDEKFISINISKDGFTVLGDSKIDGNKLEEKTFKSFESLCKYLDINRYSYYWKTETGASLDTYLKYSNRHVDNLAATGSLIELGIEDKNLESRAEIRILDLLIITSKWNKALYEKYLTNDGISASYGDDNIQIHIVLNKKCIIIHSVWDRHSDNERVEDKNKIFNNFKELCCYYNINYSTLGWTFIAGLLDYSDETKGYIVNLQNFYVETLNTNECYSDTEVDTIISTEDLGAGKHRTVVPPLNISDNTLRKQAEYTINSLFNSFERFQKMKKNVSTDINKKETTIESKPYTIEDFNNNVQGISAKELEIMCRIKQAVLLISYPGTGKTTAAIEFCRYITEETNSDRALVLSFNQNTSYTDTIGGIGKKDADTDWEYIVGLIADKCDKACKDPYNIYTIVLDEMNRANTSAVFGELITAMSKRGERIVTNSGRVLVVPKNVWFIGTMNSTDNSTAELDTALKDRFMLYRIPEVHIDCEKIKKNKEKELGITLSETLVSGMECVADAIMRINEQLRTDKFIGIDNQIGNRALYNDHTNIIELVYTVRNDIKPKVEDKYKSLDNEVISKIESIFDELEKRLKSLASRE